jgi:DNA-binding transcriptional regulator YhcF (GntR family)
MSAPRDGILHSGPHERIGFVIQPSAPEPIFRPIAGQIRRLVASRQLVPGDFLPSVRDVAEFHAINPMTVPPETTC